MSNSESMEMYLETIHILEKSHGHGHAHGVEIAKRLGVSKPSVSRAMNYLKEKGLVNKEAYGTITLTTKGKEISRQIYTNHKLISLFLEDSLGLTVNEADENACKMEHVLSDRMLEAIEVYLHKKKIKVNR
ncbi:metal-dependent transcriptional regulator [Alkaliphilus pronyensis]|uniref:Metal-dependent transcriptional regulator n=1 Tax=Alkaliphilus pronyensis TaxID=1482732 RepID=A0A6I0EYR0_9FIRM|nr:metal-dependent transcriptional regulator [Alkaliphilus pronyensis]KAB3534070.1 metal-dependent transcriptional regulator [Alkaliphilus pronyensis]